jgi:RNA polymerase sigma-70 factor (family 1)
MTIVKLFDEKMLFQKISEGNEESFKIFFDRYKNRLFRFIKNITKSGDVAEELMHDVFLKIWTEKQSLAIVENPEVFIFVIAKNKALSHLRKIAREGRLLEEVALNMLAFHDDTNELVEANDSNRLIQDAVKSLSPQQQRIYDMSRNEGLSHDQIADVLQISKSTVNNHLTTAMKQIRVYLLAHNREILMLFLGFALKK